MKVPVFDIGDTLTPSRQFSKKFFREYMKSRGVENPPEYPFSKYNEFIVEDLREWLEEEGIELEAEEMRDDYVDTREKQMRESGVLEELEKISTEIGPVGILSDNSLEAKEYFSQILRKNGVKFEGFVVSDEIEIRKPEEGIFREFLDRRGVEGSECVYFGNRGDIDAACEKAGMKFVMVTAFDNFDTSWNGTSIEKVTLENVRRCCQ